MGSRMVESDRAKATAATAAQQKITSRSDDRQEKIENVRGHNSTTRG